MLQGHQDRQDPGAQVCLLPFAVLHLHADSRARGQHKWWPCCGFTERHDDQLAKTSDISRVGRNSYYRVGDAAMEQALVYEKLPRDIAERHVLLLDPMLGCGSSAVKAIEVWRKCGHTPHLPPLLPCSLCAGACRYADARGALRCRGTCARAPRKVLLEKGVEEGKIFFLTLIAAPEGLTNICRRYPKVSRCLHRDHLRTPFSPSCQMGFSCGTRICKPAGDARDIRDR